VEHCDSAETLVLNCPRALHDTHTHTTVLQWLRPRVVYSHGDAIVDGAGGRHAFQFREAGLLSSAAFPAALLTDQVVVQPGNVQRPESAMRPASSLGPSLATLPGSIKARCWGLDLELALHKHA
jgi:hypothetical protein